MSICVFWKVRCWWISSGNDTKYSQQTRKKYRGNVYTEEIKTLLSLQNTTNLEVYWFAFNLSSEAIKQYIQRRRSISRNQPRSSKKRSSDRYRHLSSIFLQIPRLFPFHARALMSVHLFSSIYAGCFLSRVVRNSPPYSTGFQGLESTWTPTLLPVDVADARGECISAELLAASSAKCVAYKMKCALWIFMLQLYFRHVNTVLLFFILLFREDEEEHNKECALGYRNKSREVNNYSS